MVADEDEVEERWQEHPLGRTAPLIRECLGATAEEAGYLVVVSDANGVLMLIEGNPHIRMRAAEGMNFAEGTLWSEPGTGTNAIGTALAVDHAVQVFGAEHFNEDVQRWTCSAAPIHDPDSGALIGVIDLTGRRLHGPSRQPRGGHGDGARRGDLAAARAAGARRADPRALRRRGRHGPRGRARS